MDIQTTKIAEEIRARAEDIARAIKSGKDIEIQARSSGIVILEASKKIIR